MSRSVAAGRSIEDRRVEVTLRRAIVELAREASLEINVPEIKHLAASREILSPGKKMYVSHLPKQSWADTIAAVRAVRASGFDPVPHVPVRLLRNAEEGDRLLAALSQHAEEVLLISGDYVQALGPFSSALEFMRAGILRDRGFTRVSFAGHPEGHPGVAVADIRCAEIEKAHWAQEAGLSASIVTQFFFESAPFIQWVSDIRRNDVRSRIIAGVAGPASIAKLVRFGVRCGVGRSLRALGAGPNVLARLLDDHGPESLIAELAQARLNGAAPFDGIHLFGFGGFLRTCEWLRGIGDDTSAS